MMQDIENYLHNQIDSSADGSDLKELWQDIEKLYFKRLWHQLTNCLQKLIVHPSLQTDVQLIDIYSNFISDFADKLNPLRLMELCFHIVKQYRDDQADALSFLETICTIVKSNKEALSLNRILVGNIYLHKLKQAEKTKEILLEVENIFESIDGVGSVHGRYYLLMSDLYKMEGKHAEYYSSSLKYLGCGDELSTSVQRYQAYHLCISALLGDGIYNFGELLAHPILTSLEGTDEEWLVRLLRIFNSGDVQGFRSMHSQWSKQSDLAVNEAKLFDKMCLLALMEMTFRRMASDDRQLTFAQVTETTNLPLNKVELLVMKAVSQGLVKGYIDQVSSTINLTWVQPRVLDKTQLKTMVSKIDKWYCAISNMEMMIESKARDIITV